MRFLDRQLYKVFSSILMSTFTTPTISGFDSRLGRRGVAWWVKISSVMSNNYLLKFYIFCSTEKKSLLFLVIFNNYFA